MKIVVAEEIIEQVKEFCYLGSMISDDVQRNQEKDSNSGVNLVKIWGSWIRVKQISSFTGKFPKILIFFRQLKKIDFPSKKLSIYSYLWANYSISLQKLPLSNILPVHDKI